MQANEEIKPFTMVTLSIAKNVYRDIKISAEKHDMEIEMWLHMCLMMAHRIIKENFTSPGDYIGDEGLYN